MLKGQSLLLKAYYCTSAKGLIHGKVVWTGGYQKHVFPFHKVRAVGQCRFFSTPPDKTMSVITKVATERVAEKPGALKLDTSTNPEDNPVKEKPVDIVKEAIHKASTNLSTEVKITFPPVLGDNPLGRIPEANKKVVAQRVRVDPSTSSMERNFITPARAMADFLLKPEHLEELKATKRRSPYDDEPPILVYWRKDVEAKAIQVWGTKEALLKELLQRELERKFYHQNIFTSKRRLRVYRRERNSQTEAALNSSEGIFGSSGRVVLTAIAINGTNFLFKLFAWIYTGSHSMFSECIHSLADTINQLILAYGIHKSVQRADSEHPYGYSNMKYVSSLISGVGIFCVGTGLSIYHGISGLVHPVEATESFFWAYCILGGSLVSEGATLLVAINSVLKGAKSMGISFKEYVWRSQDPSVNVVLLEDLAAVLGVGVAGVCMGLTSFYGSHIPDAVGSIIIGGLLGGVASFIIYTNVAALVGRSIPQEYLDKINAELEADVMIRAIHDVKGIDMGNSLIRYKAELDFDGRELARAYLDSQDISVLLKEVQGFKHVDELEAFILRHSELIIDKMGGEIDRIEVKLRKKFPDIRHCDLEIL